MMMMMMLMMLVCAESGSSDVASRALFVNAVSWHFQCSAGLHRELVRQSTNMHTNGLLLFFSLSSTTGLRRPAHRLIRLVQEPLDSFPSLPSPSSSSCFLFLFFSALSFSRFRSVSRTSSGGLSSIKSLLSFKPVHFGSPSGISITRWL